MNQSAEPCSALNVPLPSVRPMLGAPAPHRNSPRAAWLDQLPAALIGRRFAFVFASVAAVFVLAGCAGYKLGPTNGAVAGGRSVTVNFFANKTQEPRLIEAVNGALRRRIQQDGTLRLDTTGGGDIVLTGEITAFERSGISFNPSDIATVQDYTLRLITRVKATDRATGKVVLDNVVSGKTSIRIRQDLVSTERQVVPLAAADLADRIVSLLVDGAW